MDTPVSAREQIIDQLRWGASTVDELAQSVGLTANGVRMHLATLRTEGLVQRAGVRRHKEGAGKPPHLYALTPTGEEALSRAYPDALVAVVEALRATHGDYQLEAVLAEAGRRLASATTESDPQRLLESLGARVRATPLGNDDVRLEGAGCPLSAVVRREPESCELVRSLLASASGRPVKRRCVYGDSPRCCFEL
jgi:predicted ArsR family transcriptional regulator